MKNTLKKDIRINSHVDKDYSYCSTIKTKSKKIISIISNKGGVGKTSIACCFALSLSRELNKKTLLLELDCSPGDFGTLFDINQEMSLEMAVRFSEGYKKYVKNIGKKLDVLRGVQDPIIAESIDSKQVDDFLRIIINDYDYIIVDTHTVLNGILLDFIKASDLLIMVSDPTMESIARVSSYLQLLSSRFQISRNRFKFVINKKRSFSYQKIWEISKIINLPINSLINFDSKFNKSNVLFNESKMLRSSLFKQVSRTIRSIDTEFSKC
jgi:pilus assembly protein CpaE